MRVKEGAVIFDRVSSADQRDGFSLGAQRDVATKYVKLNNLTLVRSWSVDESAAKHSERKHFFEMIAFIEKNIIKNVIFDKVDRAVRNLKSAVEIERLVDNGVKFHFAREHLIIDSASPSHDKMRFYLGIILATVYIDNLKAEISKGLNARTEQGLWNHIAPFGYKNIREGKNQRAVVVVDELEGPVASEVFELYSTGNYSLDALVAHVKSKCPEKKLTKRLIETMLTNPFYFGYLPTRKSRQPKIKGAHVPLISRDVWNMVQKVKGIRGANNQAHRFGVVSKPLMGIFKCGVCGHAVTGESHKKSSGKIHIYYRCANLKCEQKRKNTPQLSVMTQIEHAFEPFRHFTIEATQAFTATLSSRLEDLDLFTQKMSTELAEKRLTIKKSVEKLERLHADGILSEDEYREVISLKERAIKEIKIEIAAYNEADYKTFNMGLRLIELFSSICNYMQSEGNELEKARIAKLVLSNAILKDGTIEYDYQKPFDVLLKLASNDNWWRWRELNPRPQELHREALHT